MVGGGLVSVGGVAGNGNSPHVLTLQQNQWSDKYPPMNTARVSPAVLAVPGSDSLVVVGGRVSGARWTPTVEVYQTKSKKWRRLTDLPQPLTAPSAALCSGDAVLHVIGHENTGYSCSLQALVTDGDQPGENVWRALPPLPVTHSTAATLCGELVLVGGRQGSAPVKSIYQLLEGQWVVIGSMASQRERCLAVNLSPERLLIVSGVKAWGSVEECTAL